MNHASHGERKSDHPQKVRIAAGVLPGVDVSGAAKVGRSAVLPCALPQASLLRRYKDVGYADCYTTEVAGGVSQAAFVEAFYTTGLFKIERAILKWFARRPATDLDAKQLSVGAVAAFAAWRVEAQSAEQLLLADLTGRTRSWLMADSAAATGSTRLYFGSAVVPRQSRAAGPLKMGSAFHALLGFHRLYSRLLLKAASARLMRVPGS